MIFSIHTSERRSLDQHFIIGYVWVEQKLGKRRLNSRFIINTVEETIPLKVNEQQK